MTNNRSSSILHLEHINIDHLTPPKALVFDLDLTIHDVMSHYDTSVNKTLLYFGFKELSNERLIELGRSSFISSRNLFAEIVPENLVEEILEYYYNHFLNNEIPEEAILPGAKELLELVKDRFKLPIIAVTNSEEPMAIKVLNDLKINNLFDYVIGIKEDESFKKPNPQMLLTALKDMNLTPGPHIWFIGDMPSDVECAKRANNCTAIRYYTHEEPEDLEADLFINSHYNLFNIIKSKLG